MIPGSSRRRVFYVAPVAAHRDARALESPAARNKVFGIAGALAVAGAASFVVSTTGTDASVTPFRPLAISRRPAGSPSLSRPLIQVFAGRSSGVARRLSATVFLVIFAIRMVRRGDIVLLYNGYPDYLLLALVCRVIGAACVLDIEDWAPPGSRSALDRLVRVSQRLLLRWCAPRQVTVSRQLGEMLSLDRFLPVYGAASFHATRRPSPAFSLPVVRILYGGSIMHETGLDLFEEAIADLRQRPACLPLHILVSGSFDRARLSRSARPGAGSGLEMTLCGDLTAEEYRALCDTIDIGLCLKLSRHVMGQTTFPSKVIEIAAKGMLLISTPVSDVPVIFDETCAVILPDDDPQALAAAIRDAAADRAASADRARRGRERVEALFDAGIVGRSMLTFLETA